VILAALPLSAQSSISISILYTFLAVLIMEKYIL